MNLGMIRCLFFDGEVTDVRTSKPTKIHFDLTPMLKMRVSLAAQVMSDTVRKKIERVNLTGYNSLKGFITHVHRLIDVCNTRVTLGYGPHLFHE